MAFPANLNLELVQDGPFTDGAGPLLGYFEAVNKVYRRDLSNTKGVVIAPAKHRIDLDGNGSVSKLLPANYDQDYQGTDTYTVTAYLKDSTGAALTVPIAPFEMQLYEGGGPYRLSDFMFGEPPVAPPTGGGGGNVTVVEDDGVITFTGSGVTEDPDGVITITP